MTKRSVHTALRFSYSGKESVREGISNLICREEILSNDFVDYIWKTDAELVVPYLASTGVCAQYVNPNYIVIYVPRDEGWIAENLPAGDYGMPACHTQLDMDTGSLEQTGILRIQEQPALNLTGNGVLMGFLDSGIALELDVFRHRDGSTRVLGLWDQTDQSGTPPEGMLYGSEYTKEECYSLLDSCGTLPGADENGHGTKVVSIAAGSKLANGTFLGAAPDADIAFVKLKPAKPFIRQVQEIPQDSVAYQESDLMLAVRYLDRLAARERKALVICLALGSNAGGHTGNTPLGLYLDDLSVTAGRAVAVAAGNEGNQAHHFYGEVPEEPGYLDVELRVGEQETGFQLNLWGNAPGMFSTEIVSPSGERVPRFYPRILEFQRHPFLFENTVLDIQYELSENVSGDERLLLTFRNPTSGVWRLRIYSIGNLDNRFHIWLPVTGFVSEGTYFLRPDPDTTITEPANAGAVLTAAGYEGRTDSVWLDAGRGYTRTGQFKPDLAAPAVSVAATDRFGNAGTLTGSSASAALAAGASALMMEWGVVQNHMRTMDGVTIQRFLTRGLRRPDGFSYPNRNWGYGLLNLYGAFAATRGIDA